MSLACPVPCISSPPPLQSHRWKVLAAGVLANVAFSITINGLPLTAVLLRSSYALDTTSLALVLGLMGLGVALSELPWGILTDRLGDRPVLLVGLGGTALALLALAMWAAPQAGYIPSLPVLACGLVAVGLLGGSVNGASGRAIMAWFSDRERGLAMSIRQTAVPLGGVLGALLLPWLAAWQGFAAVYALLAAFSALAALLAFAWVNDPPHSGIRQGVAAPSGMAALRNAGLWRLSLGIGLLCAPQFAVLSFGTVFLHDTGHVGAGLIAAAMATLQIGAMALRIWSGYWTDRRRNRGAYLRNCTWISALLFAALALVSWAGWQGWALAALLTVCGIAISAWHGVAYAELATQAGAARAGTALGLANTVVFLANFLTPQGIAQLLQGGSWALVWAVAGAIAFLTRPLLVLPPANSAAK